jgi:tetratricopeptide (TPR) repeat protein
MCGARRKARHLAGLREADRYPGHIFTSPTDLAKHIAYTAVLDLLVTAYGEEAARSRDVAEGFIHEMAKKVAGNRNLDFEDMKQAVRKAIDIYETEIAGGQTQTNIDVIVDEALRKARKLADVGKSGLARAALRRAAEAMRRDEEDRHERYVAGATALYNRDRDIALAAYDGVAAAEAVILLAEAIHGANAIKVAQSLNSEAEMLHEYGQDRGSNVHLVAEIMLRRRLSDVASSDDERNIARSNLGVALQVLGERESGTARLEEAVAAYRNALKEWTRERVPLQWSTTQNNLGVALQRLGARERGTERLEEAVAAFRDALKERTRERLPLDWAMTQNNLGNALQRLGARERGTERLEEAVAAYRDALEELTRENAPHYQDIAQENLDRVLGLLGKRTANKQS